MGLLLLCSYEDFRATPLCYREMASCYEDFRANATKGMLLLCCYEDIRANAPLL